jgi:flagellar protein FlaG
MQVTTQSLSNNEAFRVLQDPNVESKTATSDKSAVGRGEKKEQDKIAQFMEEEQKLAKQRQAQADESIESAVQTVSEFAKLQNLKLNFTEKLHNGSAVVQVVDIENDKVVRQIPSEEFLKVAGRISDIIADTQQVKGLLFESQV